MGNDINFTPEAWAEFEALLVRVEHQGHDRIVKEIRAHIERYGWQEWWPISDKWHSRDHIFAVYREWSRVRYSEHRRSQLLDGKFKYWIYHHGNSLDPRPSHVAWEGIALPPDHPFWDLHFPPCGWGCSCYVSGTHTEAGIRRLRGDPDKALPDGWNVPLPHTGRPLGVDWQFAGQRWPTLRQILDAVLSGKTR